MLKSRGSIREAIEFQSRTLGYDFCLKSIRGVGVVSRGRRAYNEGVACQGCSLAGSRGLVLGPVRWRPWPWSPLRPWRPCVVRGRPFVRVASAGVASVASASVRGSGAVRGRPWRPARCLPNLVTWDTKQFLFQDEQIFK